MPEIAADSPSPSCCHLFSRPGIQESQQLALFVSCARRAGAFREGKLRQSAGAAARHPQSQAACARSCGPAHERAGALSELLDHKPHLLLPLAEQLLPPPRAAIDPAERLGIDLASSRTVKDFRQVLSTVLAGVAHGEIAPAEAARIARRVRVRLRAARRLARLGAPAGA
jgi:hypothetical protein